MEGSPAAANKAPDPYQESIKQVKHQKHCCPFSRGLLHQPVQLHCCGCVVSYQWLNHVLVYLEDNNLNHRVCPCCFAEVGFVRNITMLQLNFTELDLEGVEFAQPLSTGPEDEDWPTEDLPLDIQLPVRLPCCGLPFERDELIRLYKTESTDGTFKCTLCKTVSVITLEEVQRLPIHALHIDDMIRMGVKRYNYYGQGNPAKRKGQDWSPRREKRADHQQKSQRRRSGEVPSKDKPADHPTTTKRRHSTGNELPAYIDLTDYDDYRARPLSVYPPFDDFQINNDNVPMESWGVYGTLADASHASDVLRKEDYLRRWTPDAIKRLLQVHDNSTPEGRRAANEFAFDFDLFWENCQSGDASMRPIGDNRSADGKKSAYRRICKQLFEDGEGVFSPLDPGARAKMQKRVDDCFKEETRTIQPLVADGTVLSFVTTDWEKFMDTFEGHLFHCYHASHNCAPSRKITKWSTNHFTKIKECVNKLREHRKWLWSKEEQQVPMRERKDRDPIRDHAKSYM